MGFMTLKDFRDQVNLNLGDRRESSNDRLDNWINRGYVEVAFSKEQEWMKICNVFTTIADQYDYALPSDFFAFISLADRTNKRRLVKTDLANYMLKDQEKTGKPQGYARRRDTLYLWPTPDGAYSIEMYYFWNPPILTAEADQSMMGHFFDHAIVLLATRNAWLALGDMEKATLFHQSADNYIRRFDAESGWAVDEPQLGVDVAYNFDDLGRQR